MERNLKIGWLSMLSLENSLTKLQVSQGGMLSRVFCRLERAITLPREYPGVPREFMGLEERRNFSVDTRLTRVGEVQVLLK